ncbi:uncharacterized protein [Pempheris klunzingeri]|uniref:uncharacterized protein n=1 Tax=Pempheris klunzingeri TaxID=3127111 RepID=UPI0039806C67
MFHRFWKRTQRGCEDGDQTGSQCGHESPDGFTSESRILHRQRAERAVLTQRAERLCAAENGQNDAVLERLGLSSHDVTVPSPQPPALPRKSPKTPQRERRLLPVLDAPRLSLENRNRNQRRSECAGEDDSFWDKVLLGSQMAVLACEEAKMADRYRSPTDSVYSFSSVDAHTPSELRAMSLIRSPAEVTNVRTPPQTAPSYRRRLSRLPVFSASISRADKEVVAGCKLQSARNKVNAIVQSLEHLQLNSVPSPRPPEAPRRTPAVAPPLAPTPPTCPQTKKRGAHPGRFLHPGKAVIGKKMSSNCSLRTTNEKKVELQPLANAVESLSLSFKLLHSHDWMKKIEGLKIVQALAQHHSETLKTKLHEVCLLLIEEVKNLRSAVACAAMNTLAELYVHLQKAMDPEVEVTGRALLLKLAQTTNAFVHQQANLALGAMVQHCSHGRSVSALLNTGLSHRCAAVRGSMAKHLHQLADGLGAVRILTAGKSFTERFLTAVAKMSVDAAPDVRHHGQIILQELVLHTDFMNLWTEIVPDKERRPLSKIIKRSM